MVYVLCFFSCVCKDTQVNEVANNSCIGVFKTVSWCLCKRKSLWLGVKAK